MNIFESNNGFRRIAMWDNEEPFEYVPNQKITITIDSDKCIWNNRTVCIEAKLNPKHASNYAMVCMKYTHFQSDKTNITIYYGKSDMNANSNYLFNKNAVVGLDKEYAEAIYDFFKRCPKGSIPSGTIEIMGAYDKVGSSKRSFECVMKILIWIFSNYYITEYKSFGDKLLSIMYSLQQDR